MELIEHDNLIGSINGAIVDDAGFVAGRNGLALSINGMDQYVEFLYQGATYLGSSSSVLMGG